MQNNQVQPTTSSLYRKSHRAKDNILKAVIFFCTFFTVAVLIIIIGYILINGLPHISLKFLTTTYSNYDSSQHGILTMIINTLYMIVLTLLFSVPIGILSAVYLTQYAKQGKLVKIIRFATETLAGLPSILFGLFGAAFLGVSLHLGYSILCGSLTLAIMVLPIIIRTTEEALLAVPAAYKEGGLALGAKKLRVIFGIILPNAMSGILTSVILAMGRIVGESAALIFTAGLAYSMSSNIFKHIMESGRTLTLHLYQLAMLGENLDDTFASAAVLLIIIFVLNVLAGFIARRFKKD